MVLLDPIELLPDYYKFLNKNKKPLDYPPVGRRIGFSTIIDEPPAPVPGVP